MLDRRAKKITMRMAYRWLNDVNATDNNSIFRVFTLASWLLVKPNEGPAKLWVRFTSSAQDYAVYRLKLTPQFWRQPKKFIKPFKPNLSVLHPIHYKSKIDPYYQNE